MDWRATKFDWNHARAFLVTVEEGSLSSAARALGTTQPTLGRQMAALEKELGIVLFERSRQGLEPTPHGRELLAYVRVMCDAADQLSLSASGYSTSNQGDICISASEFTAAYLMPPIIQELKHRQPDMRIKLIAANSASDLKRREADIALRFFRPSELDLITRKLKDLRVRLYATPNYLKSIDNPKTLEALANRGEFIGFDEGDRFKDALAEIGMHLKNEQFAVLAENHIVNWQLVKQGMGIGIIPEDIGDADHDVVRAIHDHTPIQVPLWIVTHRELRTNRRVQTVFNLLIEAFTQQSDDTTL